MKALITLYYMIHEIKSSKLYIPEELYLQFDRLDNWINLI